MESSILSLSEIVLRKKSIINNLIELDYVFIPNSLFLHGTRFENPAQRKKGGKKVEKKRSMGILIDIKVGKSCFTMSTEINLGSSTMFKCKKKHKVQEKRNRNKLSIREFFRPHQQQLQSQACLSIIYFCHRCSKLQL